MTYTSSSSSTPNRGLWGRLELLRSATHHVRSPCPRAHVLPKRDAARRDGHSPEWSLGGVPASHVTPPVADSGLGSAEPSRRRGWREDAYLRRGAAETSPAAPWRCPAARLCLCAVPLRSPTGYSWRPRSGSVSGLRATPGPNNRVRRGGKVAGPRRKLSARMRRFRPEGQQNPLPNSAS